MKAVCSQCLVEFQPEKNGVYVIETYMGDSYMPYKVYAGDLWKCPKCGHEIIIGLSQGVVHYDENFDAIYKVAMKNRHFEVRGE